MRDSKASAELFNAAARRIPGGASNPSGHAGGPPEGALFIRQARGCMLTDIEGQRYIDYACAGGATLFGHGHSEVLSAMRGALREGGSQAVSLSSEVELAELIAELCPTVEMLRLVNSRAEATMSAVRLVRAATRRDYVLKFRGGYHGDVDGLLEQGVPQADGVPEVYTALTLSTPYNDLTSAEKALSEHPGQVAAVIVEPVASGMGVVPPREGFLSGLRELCDRHDCLLIFDEATTGFRVARGGAAERYGVTPDLTLLGRVIGGGLPMAAYGGRASIMQRLAPQGHVYQAGAFSGSAVILAAGLATLALLRGGEIYDLLESLAAQLEEGLRQSAAAVGVPIQVNRVGSMLSLFFSETPVVDDASMLCASRPAWQAFYHGLLAEGVVVPASPREPMFLSTAHGRREIKRTITAAATALEEAGRAFRRTAQP